jgi:signal peptidase I
VRRLPLLALGFTLIAGCGSSTQHARSSSTTAATTGSSSSVATGLTRTYRVPSGAMLPTLHLGERIVVSLDPKYTPHLGDIVVFHPPTGSDSALPVCGNRRQGVAHSAACSRPTPVRSSQVFVKRIVAGPSDTLRIVGGHVILNGQRKPEPFITPCDGPEPECDFPAQITIPARHYFVLGDNRGASDDSRFWGPVARDWIVGKVIA